MKTKLLRISHILAMGMLCGPVTYAQQLSFPGAEGWGRFATGGRMTDSAIGSKVYYVTTLEDYISTEAPVEGSLRWALSDGDDTPRTVLFKVCGTINLRERLKFSHPNITIAGQSAPGGGICISGANIYVCKNNVIIRYMRFRAGDKASSNYSALDIENVSNVMIDHCSFSWSMEENVTMYDNKYTTMQWCILSEPLYYSAHKKGERGYGSQWGGEHSSYHHNLLAHCVSRAPRINGARDKSQSGHDAFVDTEVAYNVIYNWGNKGAVYGGELEAVVVGAYSRTNLYGNYFKPGPMTNTFQERWFADCSHTASKATGYGEWYIEGNMFEINEYKNDKNGGNHTALNENNWLYGETSNSKKAINLRAGIDKIGVVRLSESSESSNLPLKSAEMAYRDVISNAGAWYPRLDEVDRRILSEAAGIESPKDYGVVKVSGGTPTTTKYIGAINSQDDLKPTDASEGWTAWPDLCMREGETVSEDTDADGIPDKWEEANGLNKLDGNDGGLIAENGYSHLENYLNGLVEAQYPSSLEDTKGQDNALATFYHAGTRSLHFNLYAGASKLMIYTMNGSLVAEKDVRKFDKISVQELPNDTYLLQWFLTDGSQRGEKLHVW